MSKKKPNVIVAIEPNLEVKQLWFTGAVLFVLGIYQSIVLFGHTVIPNPDFPCFVQISRAILSFNMPPNFTRAPVVGILCILCGKMAGGLFPDLTGGWLSNAILHPFNVLLLWLIAKRLIGKTAVWFAVIVSILPWTLYMLTEPLAETPLLFFILLSIYLICRSSRWAYMAASLATMVRYEAAALIFAAFVIDFIERKNKKDILIALSFSALASLPLMLWLLGMFLTRDTDRPGGYLFAFTKGYAKYFSDPEVNKTGLWLHLKLLWSVGFKPLFMIDPTSGRESFEIVWGISQFVAFFGSVFGIVYGLFKKNKLVVVLLIFLIPYLLIHAYYPHPVSRFHSTSCWVALLMSIYGIKQLWSIITKRFLVPNAVAIICQGIVLFVMLVLILPLTSYMGKLAAICPDLRFLPYVIIAAIFLVILFRLFNDGFKKLIQQAAILSVMSFVVLSNQYSLAPFLNDGQKNIEFKYLAEWYLQNAKQDEKLAIYMDVAVELFIPEYSDVIIKPPEADTPKEFYLKCKQEGITYVAWASREGLRRDHYLYNKMKLNKNIAMLRYPKDIGPYKFLTQIKSKRGYINVFTLGL